MTDVTVALAFILYIFAATSSFTGSEVLAETERVAYREDIREDVLEAFESIYGDTLVEVRESDQARLVVKGGTVVAKVWINGSFLRIAPLERFFDPSSSRLSEQGAAVYTALGEVIKMHGKNVTYLYCHGIAEPQEIEGDASQSGDAGTVLSRARADAVFSLYQGINLISPDDRIDDTRSSTGSMMIPRKFAISYGTGEKLYPEKRDVGRVDIVLFVTEGEDS